MSEDMVEAAVAGIADRTVVDWDALSHELGPEGDRRWLSCLRILERIADLHERGNDLHEAKNSVDSSAGETNATTTRASTVAPRDSASYWGRYRLVQRVGEGGFGSVHRAWDPELEREVAIKILHKRVADSRLREGVLREGRALARVRHPNVVSVLGVETQDDQVALCMEFVRGETLEEVLQRHGTLSGREAALVGEDVCRALAAVHYSGFVHRDVKAKNVMRESAGRIVLMDFGAGREADPLGRSARGDSVGTPLYMAPELLDDAGASAASDVYAVGVLLYHLVTGAYPVEGGTLEEIRAAHGRGQRRLLAERRPDLSPSFIRVVDTALAPSPAERYSTAAALLQALGTVQGDRSKKRVVLIAAGLPIVAGLTVGLFGFLTTAAYNLNLGRGAPFDQESPAVWLEMGLRSVLSPIVYMGLALLVVSSLTFAGRVLRVAQPIERLVASGARRLGPLSARLGLDDPRVFSQAVTSLGIIVLAIIAWRFSSVILAYTTFTISDAPAERLLPLRLDEQRVDPSNYRLALDMVALGLGLALIKIRRLGRREPGATWAASWPVAALLVFTVLLIELPFRFVWRAEGERVELAGQRCYVLGEHEGRALVHCPDRTPPRNHVVAIDDPALRRLGLIENIFTPPETPK